MKDLIATWLLAIWILVTGYKPLLALGEALRAGESAATIAWRALVALIVTVVGIFLIRRYLVTLADLHYYKGLEDARQREARERRSDTT
jgi:hypothetical protein